MYTTIKLPDDLVAKIDSYIENSDDGYTSRTDLVKMAVRQFFSQNNFNGEVDRDGNGKED